jgi:hypothetical protein
VSISIVCGGLERVGAFEPAGPSFAGMVMEEGAFSAFVEKNSQSALLMFDAHPSLQLSLFTQTCFKSAGFKFVFDPYFV